VFDQGAEDEFDQGYEDDADPGSPGPFEDPEPEDTV
jgi:hypothetical protein